MRGGKLPNVCMSALMNRVLEECLMESAVLPYPRSSPITESDCEPLLRAFLDSKSPKTVEAYAADLLDFTSFLQQPSPVKGISHLLSQNGRDANVTIFSYRAALIDRGLQPSTVNRRLSALRSLITLAKALGVVDWSVIAPNLRVQPYRDTRGPSRPQIRQLFRHVLTTGGKRGIRDYALLRLLYDCALRRNEAVTLDLSYISLAIPQILVLRKGTLDRSPLTLASPTTSALRSWLEVRGDAAGPVFLNLDRAGKGERLTGVSVNRVVAGWGREIGLRLTAHQLRHAAITHALDATGGDVRAVARFSGHRQIQTLLVYDDNRNDLAGHITNLVALAARAED
jgi:integrase/recombinase XerC